jgi:hypothetical protein
MSIKDVIAQAEKQLNIKYPCLNLKARKDLADNFNSEIGEFCGCENCNIRKDYYSYTKDLLRSVVENLPANKEKNKDYQANGYNSALFDISSSLSDIIKKLNK